MKLRKLLETIAVELLILVFVLIEPIHEFYMNLRGYKWDKLGAGWVNKKDGTPKR